MATKKKIGLGKGFGALIPDNFDSSLLLDNSERVHKLLLASVIPNPKQPRKKFDEESLRQLAQSIKNYGVLQPIVVTPGVNKTYTLIAGERRWRAAHLAGLNAVPAIVRTSHELEQLEISLVENVQRVDLSPLEQAVSIARLHEQFNIGYEDIAKRLGKAGSTVSNLVRLLQLPEIARKALEAKTITEGHARAILALNDLQNRQELLKLILEHKWTVRQAEQYVTGQKQGLKTSDKARQRTETSTPTTKKLSAYLKAPVNLKRTAHGGKLEIGFSSEQDLERLVKKIQD